MWRRVHGAPADGPSAWPARSNALGTYAFPTITALACVACGGVGRCGHGSGDRCIDCGADSAGSYEANYDKHSADLLCCQEFGCTVTTLRYIQAVSAIC